MVQLNFDFQWGVDPADSSMVEPMKIDPPKPAGRRRGKQPAVVVTDVTEADDRYDVEAV